MDTLQHSHDVLAVAFRPDGKQLAVSTLDGVISLWDPQEAEAQVKMIWKSWDGSESGRGLSLCVK
jgi:WD40 repeat protein